MVMWHAVGDGKPYSYKDNFYALAPNLPDDNWSIEYLERMITRKVWSPCVFSKGVRLESGFLASAVCALDFDSHKTLLWAIGEFYHYAHLIGTTRSHQKEKNGVVCDRFRVVLFWDKTITNLAEYKHNMKIMIAKYGADRACSDGARFFFPCTEIVVSGNGKLLHAETLPVANGQAPRRKTSCYNLYRDMPAPEGKRNVATFAAACNMIRAHLDYSTIFSRLTHIANGLSEKEISTILEHAKKYAAEKSQ